MKNKTEVIDNILAEVNNDTALFSKRCYVLYFAGINDGELYAYDATDPIRAYKAIMDKHPEYEYLNIQSYDLSSTARSFCTMMQKVREARLKLIPKSELFEVHVTPRTEVLQNNRLQQFNTST